MKRAHIFYSGNVQGVGFRYTTCRYAADSHLTGWVKNLNDGRVEILVEGDPEEIAQLMIQLEKSFCGDISNKEVLDEQVTGEFSRFDIRR